LISPILIAITKTPYKDIITLLTVFYYELTLYSSVAFFPAIVFKKSSNKKKKTFYKHTIIQRNIAILFESWERIWYNSKRCKKYVLTEYSATIVMIGMNIF